MGRGSTRGVPGDHRTLALVSLVLWLGFAACVLGVLAVAGALSGDAGEGPGGTPAQEVLPSRALVLSTGSRVGSRVGSAGDPARGSGGGEVEVLAEVADTEAEREAGLMGRPPGSLGADRGMLFVFEEEGELAFWMEDTEIPLSVAYADAEGRIVDIRDLEPLDETPRPSAEPAMYALEVNRGFFEAHGVEVGDRIAAGLQPARR